MNTVLMDNIIFELQTIGGISHYWYNLIKKQMDTAECRFTEIPENCNNYYIDDIHIPRSKTVSLPSSLPLVLRRYKNIHVNSDIDVFHSSYYRYSSNSKNVTTVHDFMYELFLNKYNLRNMVHRYQKYRAIYHSDFIISVSQSTLDDMIALYPEFRDKKMTVIYHGHDPQFYPIENKQESISLGNTILHRNEYFFYFGNRKDHKNFNTFLYGYSSLKKSGDLPKIVVAGGGEFTDYERNLISELNLKNNIVKLGFMDNKIINLLLNYAAAFVFPSIYEGFGLPVLESLASGCPVVCCDSSSLKEVGGDAPVYFQQNDTGSFERALKDVLKTVIRKQCIEKGLIQASKFSWEKAAEQTLDVYRSL
ncbi:MAG: glycosyltransferase family 1 protein [candidate division WOR-3 bacterium]|nr:glycosyltransferase family 1 protein [candidate division WOR-3 bacterium]